MWPLFAVFDDALSFVGGELQIDHVLDRQELSFNLEGFLLDAFLDVFTPLDKEILGMALGLIEA